MSEEDQEQFEDYLELERFIEELQTGKYPSDPHTLKPAQAHVYRMALLFHSSSDDKIEPRPEFIADLRERLFTATGELRPQEDQEHHNQQELPLAPESVAAQAETIPEDTPAPKSPARPILPTLKKNIFTRRTLLTGGVTAAASFVVGTAIGAGIEQAHNNATIAQPTPEPDQSAKSSYLLPEDAPINWHFVAALTALGNQAIRFSTDTVTGYVLEDKSSSAGESTIIALSATCTHMGCLLQWQQADHTFLCPCHGGRFTAEGLPDLHKSALRYLDPLPRLRTKIENGNIYAAVPAKAT